MICPSSDKHARESYGLVRAFEYKQSALLDQGSCEQSDLWVAVMLSCSYHQSLPLLLLLKLLGAYNVILTDSG